MNRRTSDRYAFRWPLRYRAAGDWNEGHTIDMSGRGMLLDIPEMLPEGTRVEVLMDWPGVYFNRDRVRLFVVGAVVRTDGRGVALRIVRRQFRERTIRQAVLPAYAAATSAPIGA